MGNGCGNGFGYKFFDYSSKKKPKTKRPSRIPIVLIQIKHCLLACDHDQLRRAIRRIEVFGGKF